MTLNDLVDVLTGTAGYSRLASSPNPDPSSIQWMEAEGQGGLPHCLLPCTLQLQSFWNVIHVQL